MFSTISFAIFYHDSQYLVPTVVINRYHTPRLNKIFGSYFLVFGKCGVTPHRLYGGWLTWNYVAHLVFQNYIKIYRLFSFPELLTGKNSFNRICLPFSFLRIAGRQKLCIIKIYRPFSLYVFIDRLPVMPHCIYYGHVFTFFYFLTVPHFSL